MTVKQFFKSTSFKCIITLLCVLLLSGIFLTVMNGLLEVTDEERLARAISSIYGKNVTVQEQVITTADVDSATIKEAYLVTDDGNYLIKSTGKEGYQGGTVTCWVVVKITAGKVSGIGKITVDSYTAQTQMAEITSSFLDKFSTGYKEGTDYTTDAGFVVTGSSMSSTAVCNSVNGAMKFVREQILGEEAKSNPYDGFEYINKINVTNANSHFAAGENGSIVFHIVTKADGEAGAFTVTITVNAEKAVENYVIDKNGSTEDEHGDSYENKMYAVSNYVGWKTEDFLAALNANQTAINSDKAEINTGASYSNYLCIYAGLFATANYQNALDKLSEGGGTNE